MLRQHAGVSAAALRTTAYTHGLGLRGLANLGNSCFVSCILQVTLHNPLLRNYYMAGLHAPAATGCALSKAARARDDARKAIGAPVEARVRSTDPWHPATIAARNADGSFDLVFLDDGRAEPRVPADAVRFPGADAEKTVCLGCAVNAVFQCVFFLL